MAISGAESNLEKYGAFFISFQIEFKDLCEVWTDQR